MAIETSYTHARAHLAELLERINGDLEVVVIQRKNGRRVVMMDADEWASLEETAHLMRSPRNAERLFAAMKWAEGAAAKPESIEDLRRELGLERG